MRKILLKLAITAVIFGVFVWSSSTTSTSKTVTVKEVNSTDILVQIRDGENVVIKIPNIVQHLILENNNYKISYTQKRWGGPKLKRIEPISHVQRLDG